MGKEGEMLKISEKSLEWSLKHIEKYGDTDIFPIPLGVSS